MAASRLASVQTVAPGLDVKPSAHAAHPVDPAVFVNVFCGQDVQAADPALAAKVPAAHCVHDVAVPPGE